MNKNIWIQIDFQVANSRDDVYPQIGFIPTTNILTSRFGANRFEISLTRFGCVHIWWPNQLKSISNWFESLMWTGCTCMWTGKRVGFNSNCYGTIRVVFLCVNVVCMSQINVYKLFFILFFYYFLNKLKQIYKVCYFFPNICFYLFMQSYIKNIAFEN